MRDLEEYRHRKALAAIIMIITISDLRVHIGIEITPVLRVL